MVKFLIGLVTGVVLVFLSFVLLFFALMRFREKPPDVASNSVLVLRLHGDIPEKAPVELPEFLGGGEVTTISSLWMDLKKAAADPHIKAIVIEPEGISTGWAKAEEIRSDLEQFRKSGKPIYAYLRSPAAKDYYLALPADRIHLSLEDALMLKGMRAEIMYYKKTADKLGVTVEVAHAGKYKDYGDMFTRSDMSPETREVIGELVTGLFGNLVDHVASARKKSAADVRALIDQGPFTSKRALQAGLVDAVTFEDQMWSELKDKIGGNLVKVPGSKYAKVTQESAGLKGGAHIALLVGEGDIVRGSASNDGSESGITSWGFVKQVRQVAGDSNVKGVVVRIDSPGGEVTASDDIWHELTILSKKKPVVISMSDVAASGGYYMALTGDPIVAYPQTETGSIGVVYVRPNLHGLYDKLGITKDSVQLGRHADIDSDYTSMTPEERDILSQGIDESYHEFVSKVAEARHRTYDQVEPFAQGRVWLGTTAKEHGLVDELGGLDTALALVKKKAGIPDKDNVTLFTYPPPESLINMLTKRSQDSLLESRLREVFGRVPFHAWMKGGYLRMMPYWAEIR